MATTAVPEATSPFSLTALANNNKRAISLVGVPGLMAAVRA
ncbi:hypothetical protein ACWGNA_07490 [Brucella cytisi]|nr:MULTISPECIES: hypothetical protein [Brucella/Ochrobactrum group]MBA8862790.1 hypothetical protein [Brucella anthropi]